MAHSRLFYELMLERSTDEAKLEEARTAIARMDRGLNPVKRARHVHAKVIAPGDELWLNAWLERAAPWLTVHVGKRETGTMRIRLMSGAPVDALASETRIRIEQKCSQYLNSWHVNFPSAVALRHAITFVQARETLSN